MPGQSPFHVCGMPLGFKCSGPRGGIFKSARCLIIKCYNLMGCHNSSVAKSCIFIMKLIMFDVVLQASASENMGLWSNC